MKRIVKGTNSVGLHSLLGERVLLMCANYFYEGKLENFNETCAELSDPGIVYETGEWKAGQAGEYKDLQKLRAERWFVKRGAIESFGRS